MANPNYVNPKQPAPTPVPPPASAPFGKGIPVPPQFPNANTTPPGSTNLAK